MRCSPRSQSAAPIRYNGSNQIICTKTGSGPASWFHNNAYSGIADLNGNIWEWCSGMRLLNGEIQIIPDNNAADRNISVSANSSEWKAITANSILVSPGSEGVVKYNYNTQFGKLYASHTANDTGII